MTASRLVLIDNYDSFTWNIYQYLVLEGAAVHVFRNDEITLEDLIKLNPSQLVISPGPGTPELDAGISNEAIKYFGGRIPVLGVCLGEQCIFTVWGGQVTESGEILHGKTSPLRHDSKGVYEGLPQDIPVTRYHSLVGTHESLPSCLEVSAWTAGGENHKGIIMGIRHRTLLVEGVQFHPESILTSTGKVMLRNFLKMKGGTWKDNEALQRAIPSSKAVLIPETDEDPSLRGDIRQPSFPGATESILEKIYRRRRLSVQAQQLVPSRRLSDLQAAYNMHLAPPQISFPQRLRQSPWSLSLMAEFKRASPSKGVISLDAVAPSIAKDYALAGASVVSVLTEPEWFKGSMEDLRLVRQSLAAMPNRPAVLCKEFIFDEYQILEARLSGADTILLIVKMLEEEQLRRLYAYSVSLSMEPLVEVNNAEELRVAASIGAKVIGINNRSLVTFDVDLNTTTELLGNIPKGTIVCALSGISGPDDVQLYQKKGVHALLIGEALMRAPSIKGFVENLLGGPNTRNSTASRHDRVVKICGIRTTDAATAAIEAGADIVSMILVEGRARCVTKETGAAISKIVHTTAKSLVKARSATEGSTSALDWFDHASASLRGHNRALLCGVFQNQPLSYILTQQKLLDLDVVQLHGEEPDEWASLIPVPVIRRFSPSDHRLGRRGYHALPLLDSATGGTGQVLDLSAVKRALAHDSGLRVMLAGGLSPTNIRSTLESLGECGGQIAGVDVSSGVEAGGVQSPEKIRQFVAAVKS